LFGEIFNAKNMFGEAPPEPASQETLSPLLILVAVSCALLAVIVVVLCMLASNVRALIDAEDQREMQRIDLARKVLYPCLGMYALSLLITMASRQPPSECDPSWLSCSLWSMNNLAQWAADISFVLFTFYFVKAFIRVYRRRLPDGLTGLLKRISVGKGLDDYLPTSPAPEGSHDDKVKKDGAFRKIYDDKAERVTKMQVRVLAPQGSVQSSQCVRESTVDHAIIKERDDPLPRPLSPSLVSSSIEPVSLSPLSDHRRFRKSLPEESADVAGPFAYNLVGQFLLKPMSSNKPVLNEGLYRSVTDEMFVCDKDDSLVSATNEEEELTWSPTAGPFVSPVTHDDVSPHEDIIVIKRVKGSPLWIDIVSDHDPAEAWQSLNDGCDCACHNAVKVKPRKLGAVVDCCGDSISSICTYD
jgi:predicted transcriptional regulator with HTH domain